LRGSQESDAACRLSEAYARSRAYENTQFRAHMERSARGLLIAVSSCATDARTRGHNQESLMSNQNLDGKQSGGIVIPALLWWAGTPLLVVIVLWALFFRG
jgi:hypothetical protein